MYPSSDLLTYTLNPKEMDMIQKYRQKEKDAINTFRS